MRPIVQLLLASISVSAMACGASGPPNDTAAPAGAPPAAVPASAPASAGAAAGQVAPAPRPTGDLEFKATLDLKQGAGVEPELRHGKIAVSSDWPASLYATFQTGTVTRACTAALVGPQAVLTAAHCVPPSGRITFSYQGHNAPYTADCTQHPRYASNADASADYALCKVDRPFAAPPGFLHETINTASIDGMPGKTIVLTGYGCISDIVSQNQIDGKYRVGTNSVDETSNSPAKKRGAASGVYAGKENNNLLTKDDPSLANLCPGDSGGPAFLETGASQGQFTSRVIVGVNSRVFYVDASQTTYGASLISSTGGPDFRSWAEDWAKNVGKVPVCGVRGTIPNCRS
jgi:Trypsin